MAAVNVISILSEILSPAFRLDTTPNSASVPFGNLTIFAKLPDVLLHVFVIVTEYVTGLAAIVVLVGPAMLEITRSALPGVTVIVGVGVGVLVIVGIAVGVLPVGVGVGGTLMTGIEVQIP